MRNIHDTSRSIGSDMARFINNPVFKLTLRRIIIVLSLAGFAYQTISVSMQYFGYKVLIKTEFQEQDALTNHEVALCIRYNDILDIDRLKNETGIEINRITGNEGISESIANENKLTLRQVFDYTPNTTDLIENCVYRPNNWDLREANGSLCRDQFQLHRFLTQERMCYNIKNTSPVKLRRDSVSLSLYAPFVLYELIFSGKMESANFVSVIAFYDGVPHKSRLYSSPGDQFFAESSERVNNVIMATPSDTRISLQEPPYETMCIPGTEDLMYDCAFFCLARLMEPHNMLPAWHLVMEDFDDMGDKRFNSLTDSRNETMHQFLREVEETCNSICFTGRACKISFTKTEASVEKSGNHSLAIRSMTSPYPDIVVTASPAMSFIDFFTFISSCFGTWFGFCFLNLYPFKDQETTGSCCRCKHQKKSNRVSEARVSQREIVLEYASFGKVREITTER